MAISLILVILGIAKPEHSEFSIIGFLFIFLLSFHLINGTLEYKTGTEETFIYGNNFSGYHWDYENPIEPDDEEDAIAYLFHKEITIQYANYQNHTMGFFLAIGSILSIVISLFNIKKTKYGEE